MTKKWSSTKSQDGTKRAASKRARQKYNPEMVKAILKADVAEPEAVFETVEELERWLND